MRALSPTDEMFLFVERHRQPMHVAGLFLLDPQEGDGRAFARRLYARFSQYDAPAAPFDERLVLTAFGYCWVKDPHFDLGNHLRLSALPSPGGQAELDNWVSMQQEIPLHRERPLWETHIVEGLSGGRVAIYSKVHHALLDGVSAMRAGLTVFSQDADAHDAKPTWSHATPSQPRPRPAAAARSPLFEVLAELADDLREQLASVPTLAREARRVVLETSRHLMRSLRGHDTQNPFSGRVTGARRFGSLSLPLERVEEVAHALGGTVNDVVVALCSSALRAYLAERGIAPTRALCAVVPVSLRHGEAGRGNRLAMLLTDLAVQEEELERRVAKVWSSLREGKQGLAKLSNEEIVGITAMTLAPTFASVMLHAHRDISQFNVIISNVPGPREPLFLDGARLCGVYPVSIVVDHVALNISFSSYAGALDFGVIACRHAVPDMARLLAHMQEALPGLESLAACQLKERRHLWVRGGRAGTTGAHASDLPV